MDMDILTLLKTIDDFLDKPRKMTQDMTEAAAIIYMVREFLEDKQNYFLKGE